MSRPGSRARRRPPAEVHVVEHRPRELLLRRLAVAAAIVLTGAVGYATGYLRSDTLRDEAVAGLQSLGAEYRALEARAEALERELGDVRVGTEIGAGADDHVRDTLAAQAARIGALEDEIRFYRNLMADEGGTGEVRIARLELLERLDGEGVRYRLLLVQSADRHDEVSGHLELAVVGEQSGERRVLEVGDLGASEQPIPFRFRYFQDVAGEIELPENFVPEGIRVVAQADGGQSWRLERTFSWQIQEV